MTWATACASLAHATLSIRPARGAGYHGAVNISATAAWPRRSALRLGRPRGTEQVLGLGAGGDALQRVALLLDHDNARSPAAHRGDRTRRRRRRRRTAGDAERDHAHAAFAAVELRLDLLALE